VSPPERSERHWCLRSFTELAAVMKDGVPDRSALNAFGVK